MVLAEAPGERTVVGGGEFCADSSGLSSGVCILSPENNIFYGLYKATDGGGVYHHITSRIAKIIRKRIITGTRPDKLSEIRIRRTQRILHALLSALNSYNHLKLIRLTILSRSNSPLHFALPDAAAYYGKYLRIVAQVPHKTADGGYCETPDFPTPQPYPALPSHNVLKQPAPHIFLLSLQAQTLTHDPSPFPYTSPLLPKE